MNVYIKIKNDIDISGLTNLKLDCQINDFVYYECPVDQVGDVVRWLVDNRIISSVDIRYNSPRYSRSEFSLEKYCLALDIKEDIITGKSQSYWPSIYRHIYFYLMKMNTGHTLTYIGGTANRVHGSVANSVKVVNDLIDTKDSQVLAILKKFK